MIFLNAAAAIFAAQLSATSPDVQTVQYYRVRPFPPPCGNGFDLSARDGLCYPNGTLPPQEQSARQGRYYGGGYRSGRYPVPCGNGADLDVRDGRCYPTGTVPRRFQEGRQYQPDYGYRRPPPGYYEDD